jgi:integral membrane protein (TIGR01906 family)
MVDVAVVFQRFFLVAAGSALLIAGSFAFSRSDRARSVLWRRLSASGLVIAVVTVVGGVGGVLLFDQAFALFHELFFTPGSWTFDAGSEKLVQLFPQQFWVETTIAVGIVIIGLSLLLWWYGGRRARTHAAYEADTADAAAVEVPA